MALAGGFMIGLAIAGLQSLLDIGGADCRAKAAAKRIRTEAQRARQDLERAADWYEQNKRARR